MVTEGARALRDPNHPVMNTISVAEMARRVGVTARTGYAKWDAEDFHVAIIRRLLRFDADPDTVLDADDIVDDVRLRIETETSAPVDELVNAFNQMWPMNIDDPNLRVAFALWPYCSSDSRVSMEIRESMGNHYDEWTKRLLTIFDSFLARHSRHLSVRGDISRADMMTLTIMLIESASFHTRLRQALGQDPLPADLPGRALEALLAAALHLHEDDEHPVDAYLERLRTLPNG
jgi:hypothetical protein